MHRLTRAVRVTRAGNVSRAPLPFERVTVVDGEVGRRCGSRWVMRFFQVHVELGLPKPCPASLCSVLVAQLFVVRRAARMSVTGKHGANAAAES